MKKTWAIFLLLGLLLTTGCDNQGTGIVNIPENNSNSAPVEIPIPGGSMVTASELPQENFYEVGESFIYQDWEFQVDHVEVGKDPSPFTREEIRFFDRNEQTRKWETLPDGYTYIKFDVTVTNKNTEEARELLYSSIGLYSTDLKRHLEPEALSEPEHSLSAKNSFTCTFQPEEKATRTLLFVASETEQRGNELLLCPNLPGWNFIMDKENAKTVPFIRISWEGD